jgi:hypothetical protein
MTRKKKHQNQRTNLARLRRQVKKACFSLASSSSTDIPAFHGGLNNTKFTFYSKTLQSNFKK